MEIFMTWKFFILYSLIFFMSYSVVKKNYDEVKETKAGQKFGEKGWKFVRIYCLFWFALSGICFVGMSIFFIVH